MSQGGSVSSSGGSGGSGILTIQGNSGSPTGPNGSGVLTIIGASPISVAPGAPNQLIISIAGTGTTVSWQDILFDNQINGNTFLGVGSGHFPATGSLRNTGIGVQALSSASLSGQENIGIGDYTLAGLTTGNGNIALGSQSGASGPIGLTTGNFNVLIGSQAGKFLATGSYNTILGEASGTTYTGAESSNILLGNVGVIGESNNIHIGTLGVGNGQQSAATIHVPTTVIGNLTATGNLLVQNGAIYTQPQQSVYVDAQSGSDTIGNGSAMNPYATLAKANSSITDNATAKRYVIVLTGTATEAAVAIKPFVSIVGFSPNSARISVTGAGNHITLDASWTGGSTSNLENITLVSSTNLSFNTSAIVGTGSQISCFNVQAGSGATWLGRAAGSDILVLSQCGFGGNISITDANIDSSLNNIGGFSFLISTNATVQIFWVSQADVFDGDIIVSETSAQSTVAQFFNSSIIGQMTSTGATALIQYDATSYPQGGFTFTSGGIASQFISSPGVIPHTSVTGATYTLVGSDYYLACNRAGTIALTFPTATGSGRTIIVKDVSGAAGTNNITATSSGATFDGVATLTINTNYGSLTLTDTATNVWSIT